MTYRIISPKPGFRVEDFRKSYEEDDFDTWDEDGDSEWEKTIGSSDELVDDMVFDRECLTKWLGTKQSDWILDLAFTISKEQAERAISVLTGLVERVSSMPFDPVGKDDETPHSKYLGYDERLGRVLYEYIGSPNNRAILREVHEVMMKEYHFTFPWDEDWGYHNQVGVMIEALKGVVRFIDENPERIVIGLFY